jgi:hypothetical protein
MILSSLIIVMILPRFAKGKQCIKANGGSITFVLLSLVTLNDKLENHIVQDSKILV